MSEIEMYDIKISEKYCTTCKKITSHVMYEGYNIWVCELCSTNYNQEIVETIFNPEGDPL
jgi:ribosomal protein L37AE/L43A